MGPIFATSLLLSTFLATSPAPTARKVVTFEGTCDASGAVELAGGLFLVGDDENNVLRVYGPQGKALTVTLLNPLELIQGKPARLGPALLLDLGGQGIRSMSRWRGRYLIIGGSASGSEGSRLFVWNGKAERPTAVTGADFTGLNPEAFVSYEDKDEILVLSDDGAHLIDGVECKRSKDPASKRFRGVWISPAVTP